MTTTTTVLIILLIVSTGWTAYETWPGRETFSGRRIFAAVALLGMTLIGVGLDINSHGEDFKRRCAEAGGVVVDIYMSDDLCVPRGTVIDLEEQR